MRTLVTGAGGAIGSAVVRMLVASGEAVIAHDADQEALERLPEAVLRRTGDLRDRTGLQAMAASVTDQPLDSVIAAHGIDGSGSLDDIDEARLRRVMEVNAATLPALLNACRGPLAQSRGSFVVVASQAGLVGESDNVAYCASKFAAVGWVRAIAPPMAAEGIRVRALCPGCTESPLLRDAQERFAIARGVDPASFIDSRRSRIPVGRFAHVEETAAAAIYMASARHPTPLVLAATGGEVLW